MARAYRLFAAIAGLWLALPTVDACAAEARTRGQAFPHVGPSNTACEARNNSNPRQLLECIRRDTVWRHMVAFQDIANQNPGPDGHPSRNIGEPGYLASAQYVAARMAAAGYSVQLQQYTVPYFNYTAMAHFEQTSPAPAAYALRDQWNPPTYSGSGNVTASVQPTAGIIVPATAVTTSNSGCSAASFTGFTPGRIALVQRGTCSYYTKVHNAELAGAVGVIIFNDGGSGHTGALRGSISATTPVGIPVAMSSYAIGANFYTQYQAARAPSAHVDVQTVHDPVRADYNVIADSPFGEPSRVVVVEGHLDAIYGAGMLDSASGSATILEVGLKLAHTPTSNHLRYVWFGGEELGLYGSQFYVDNLSALEVSKIVFDIDSDVTATPNYVMAIADPANSSNVANFPPGTVQNSQRGNDYFREYFNGHNLPYVDWSNDGTDSWSFSWRGIANTGILTGQDCCKTQDLVNKFGGTLGNYEGNLNSFDGGFVDRPFLWGDNIENNDPDVLLAVTKAFAWVTLKLANDETLPPGPVPSQALAPLKSLTELHHPKPDMVGSDQ